MSSFDTNSDESQEYEDTSCIYFHAIIIYMFFVLIS